MTRSFCLFSALFIFAAGAQINAQDSQVRNSQVQDAQVSGTTPRFGRRALVIDIDARVLEEKQGVVWEETTRRITIPGSPVGIKLVGANVIVAVQFTPFIRHHGQNVLVAQGQIWIDDPEKGISYYTSIQTIPLEFGEPIYFFPLGQSRQLDASIEIILTVSRNTAGTTETSAGNEDGH
jgi:hypothetical protein